MLWLKNHPPFDQEDARRLLRDRLSIIPEFRLRKTGMEGFPFIPLSALARPEAMSAFLSAMDWVIESVAGETNEGKQ